MQDIERANPAINLTSVWLPDYSDSGKVQYIWK